MRTTAITAAMKDADTNQPGHTVRTSADPMLLDVGTWPHLVGVHGDRIPSNAVSRPNRGV